MLQQFRKLLRRHRDARTEQDVSTVIVLHDLWLDVSTRTVRTGVVVRDEADGGDVALRVGLERGIEIAFLVEFYIVEPFMLQLFLQVFCKQQLLTGAWHGLAVFSRLRIKLGIVEESFSNIHKKCLSFHFACKDKHFLSNNEASSVVFYLITTFLPLII